MKKIDSWSLQSYLLLFYEEYEGYRRKMEYSEQEPFERLSDPEDGDLGDASSPDLSWCFCSLCASMPRLKESTCCQEFEHYSQENNIWKVNKYRHFK